jgi:hypothetical protein
MYERNYAKSAVSRLANHPAHYEHRLSRRAFMGSAAGLGFAAWSAGFLPAPSAQASPGRTGVAPKPTTNITTINGVDFALTFFGPGMDPSTITDFNGFVGVADVQGTGTATNSDGSTETLLFDTDMRFMQGAYVGQDGAVHKGAFGFV